MSAVHKSVVVEKPNLSNTIEDGTLHNSKSQAAHTANINGVDVERLGTNPNPRESMVAFGKSRPKSGRRTGGKKSKKIKKSESQQSRH